MVTAELDPLGQDLLAEIVGLLADVTGEDERWAASVTADSRLEGDLHLESVEIAALTTLLTSAHGEGIRLSEFAASLDIDQLIGLTVGDVVSYLTSRLHPNRAASTVFSTSTVSRSADDRD